MTDPIEAVARALCDNEDDFDDLWIADKDALLANARAAIAAYTKAVSGDAVAAWCMDFTGCEYMSQDIEGIKKIAAAGTKGPMDVHFLFAAPQPAPAVPAGWKLVPVEPTEVMIDAATNCDVYWNYRGDGPSGGPDDVYRAMIAAAPEAP